MSKRSSMRRLPGNNVNNVPKSGQKYPFIPKNQGITNKGSNKKKNNK